MRELRGPWQLVSDVTPQRIQSDDGRFILNFEAEGDRLHVLRAGPWHYRNDAVIFAAFNGKGNACDVKLDVIQVWAQIHGLPYELKSVDMGWELGRKLGTVVAVAHKKKMIVDKHLRVRVDMPVLQPFKEYIITNPVGSTTIHKYPVKYEKLPNVCLCCGLLGHTTEKFCSIPKQVRAPAFSTDIKASPLWKKRYSGASVEPLGPVRCSLNFEGMMAPVDLEREGDGVKMPEVVIKAVASAVATLTVSPASDPKLGGAALEVVAAAAAGLQGLPHVGDRRLPGSGSAGAAGMATPLAAVGLDGLQAAGDSQASLAAAVVASEGQGLVAQAAEQVKDVLPEDSNKGKGRPIVDATGAETIWGRWKRYHGEEAQERADVQYAAVKHAKFGVVTPPNSTSDLSSRKVAFAAILDSTAGSKRCPSEDQDFIINMNSACSESLEFKGAVELSVSCKRVCVERVEALLGVDGSVTHVTQEVDGGEEISEDRRRESVGEEKEEGPNLKEPTDPGAVDQLTGANDDARQEP